MLRQYFLLCAQIQNPATRTNLRSTVNYAYGNHLLSSSVWRPGGLKSQQRNMINTCAACSIASLKRVQCPSSQPRQIIWKVITASTPPSHSSHMNTIFHYGTFGQLCSIYPIMVSVPMA